MSVVLPAPKNPVTIVNGVFAEPSGASEEEAIAVDGVEAVDEAGGVAGEVVHKLLKLSTNASRATLGARAAPARRVTSRVLVGDSVLRAARA